MVPPNSETPTRDDEELLSSQHDRPTRDLPSPRRGKPLILSQRFILLGPLGSGGTSMVYKAYDPELDRKVAIKLLQGRRKPGHRGEERLIREAQAMAKLHHPHVVTVFDVSRYEEPDLGLDPALDASGLEVPPKGIFIVMEMVDGGDLRRWLGRRHRQWREVVDVMIGAGRGLAAAHEMGIVHRDVKPGNVLIGDDGRMLMSDFGLARAAALRSPPSGQDAPWRSGSWDERDDGDLTREGAVLGTPPYMSPEQHRGEGSDPRSDQFGFGVTVYEALFGVRPFSGTMTEMRRAKQQGRWRPVPSGSKVPSRVMAVIERAMQPDPDQRYASMGDLLRALEHAARSRAPQRAFIAGALLVVGTAIPLALLGSSEDPCMGGQAHVERAWSGERQEEIHDVFERSAAPYARAAGPRVKAEIDDWSEGWLAAYRDACEATLVRREQSQKALDLRVSCLSRQLRELETMTELMAGGDPRVVENAMVSVQSLGDVRACEDVAALSARVEPPATPEARARVDDGYGELAEARALELGGRYEKALELARHVIDEADAVGYPPLRASAAHRLASTLELMGDFQAAEEQLVAAIEAAERSRDEPTAADAWVNLVWVVGVEQPRPDEALRIARFADAAVGRLGGDRLRLAALDHNRGGVFYRLERYDDALSHYQRAYEAQHELLGDRHPTVAQTLNHIGNVLIMQERYDEARIKCEQSLEIRRSTLGERHPRVAAPLNNLAELLGRKGDHLQALAHARRALEIVEGTGRPEEIVAWILVSREQQKLGDRPGELDARRQVLALLDEHPGFDQSTRDEHRERVELLLVPEPATTTDAAPAERRAP